MPHSVKAPKLAENILSDQIRTVSPGRASAKPELGRGESETRARIIREATRLFALYGYEATSLRMIAEASGTLKGSLVYHFTSKENLRIVVLDGVLSHWKEVLPALLFAATSGENRFARILAECLDFFCADPNRARLLVRECLDQPASLRELYGRQLAPWIGLIEETIRTGQKSKEIFADLDPRAYIWQVVQMALTSIALSDMAATMLDQASDATATERLALELIRMARVSMFMEPQFAAQKNH